MVRNLSKCVLLLLVERSLNSLQKDKDLCNEGFAEKAVVELQFNQAKLGQILWVTFQNTSRLLFVVVKRLRIEALQEYANYAEHVLEVGLGVCRQRLLCCGRLLVHVNVVTVLVAVVSLRVLFFEVEAIRPENLRGESKGVVLQARGCSNRSERSKNCGSFYTRPHSSGSTNSMRPNCAG